VNLTDTHCHLDLEQFDADRGEVLARAWAAGLTRILIPGLDLTSSQRAVKLAESHPNLFTAIGVHPNDSLTWDENSKDKLKKLFMESGGEPLERERTPGLQKIVAIGEIGLDYYWDDAPHDQQHRVLKEQLALATELQLPVVLHLREADNAPEGDCARDLLEILAQWVESLRVENNPLAERPGVLHSFSGNESTAEKAVSLNFYLGITGPVTFKSAQARRALVKTIPLERLLIETDAPFLAPVPQRGRRNEPAFVGYIADKIAEIHSIHPEEIAAFTTANAQRLFVWGG
jgi:TatD DNase family protein